MSLIVAASIILYKWAGKLYGDIKDETSARRNGNCYLVECNTDTKDKFSSMRRKGKHRRKSGPIPQYSSDGAEVSINRNLGISSEARATAEARAERDRRRSWGQRSILTSCVLCCADGLPTPSFEKVDIEDLPEYDDTAPRLPPYKLAFASANSHRTHNLGAMAREDSQSSSLSR